MVQPKQSAAPPIMGEFKDVSVLWEAQPPQYPSEQSARWALRQMKHDLAVAGALALHRGRLMVHPQRMAEVAQRRAVEAMQRRCGIRPTELERKAA